MPSQTPAPARHSSRDLGRHTLRHVTVALVAVLVFVTSGVALAWHDLQSQVSTVDVTDLLGGSRPTRADGATDPSDSYEGRAVNVLVLGSDSRAGSNNVDGSEGSEDTAIARSDTAMILHVSADRRRMDVISIPRDALVDIPDCTQADGTVVTGSDDTMFNSAFSNGAGEGSGPEALAAGAACTIKTVEELTGVYIDEYVIVDFTGLSTMVDALGGVPVYVDEEIDDPDYTGLHLDVGCHTLDGKQALAYTRVRHGVGDGSDLSRIGRQQNFMAAMIRTAMRKNLLTSVDDLYAFARAALGTLTTSPGIGSLTTLAGLAMSAQSIGLDNINFVTMPNEPASWDADRVVPSAAADGVWEALRKDTPVPGETVAVHGDGAAESPTAAATDTTADTPDTTETQPAPQADTTTGEATPTTSAAEQCQ